MFLSRLGFGAPRRATTYPLFHLNPSTYEPVRYAHLTSRVRVSQALRISRARRNNYKKRVEQRVEKHIQKLEHEIRPFSIPQGKIEHYKPPTLEAWVHNLSLERLELITLPTHIFGATLRKDVVHRVVLWQRANRRQGTHKTLNRGEVSGSNRKMRPQKGQGRARVASFRSVQFRGGGRAFQKKPRSHHFALPVKVRQLALKVALSAKFAEGNLFILDAATFHSSNSKALTAVLDEWDLSTALLIHGRKELDPKLGFAARSLNYFNFLPYSGANVLDIVKARTLIITKTGLQGLSQRLARKKTIFFPGHGDVDKKTYRIPALSEAMSLEGVTSQVERQVASDRAIALGEIAKAEADAAKAQKAKQS